MSTFEGNIYSKSLQKQVAISVILPNDLPPFLLQGNCNYNRSMKTVYLLHGYSENHRMWISGSSIQEIAGKYNLAIVMPSADNSFYLNQKGTGRAYETFVGKEIVEYTRKTFGLSNKREDTFIGGISMGGFGSIHTGLKYPETFSKIMALSPALIVNELKNQKPGFDNGMADYDYFSTTFGNLDLLEESENNPEYLIRTMNEKKQTIPPIYLACGTEDFLYEKNREFVQFAQSNEVDITFRESEGVHDWKFWNQYLENSLVWMLEDENKI